MEKLKENQRFVICYLREISIVMFVDFFFPVDKCKQLYSQLNYFILHLYTVKT